jgi:two-component system, NtrC family, response regulator HydG
MAHFLRLYSARHGRKIHGFTRRATEALLKYDYPGNIRELQNLIERGTVYADNDGHIDVVHLFSGSELLPPFSVRLSEDGRIDQRPFSEDAGEPAHIGPGSFEDMERAIYNQALERNGGNVSKAARELKLTRASLDYRLGKLGMRRS